MTYKEAEDKIIQAYFRDEIRPMECRFCFCGTLHGNADWNISSGNGPYSVKEYEKMELALFAGIQDVDGYRWHIGCFQGYPYMSEEGLFNGMAKAIEALRQIHIDRGENIDPVPFKKRELTDVKVPILS